MAKTPKALVSVEALTHDRPGAKTSPRGMPDEQTRTPLQVAYLRKQQPILSHVMQDTANMVA